MARYTGPRCKLCRREGIKLFLKGNKCYSDKCPVEKRPYPPGEHGRRRRKITPYGEQLREKQKARRIYGVLERQFRRYVGMAQRERGVTGDTLMQILERRLDNVVHRLGFAASRAEGRQLVNHGHFTLNGRNVDIPSQLVSEGDVIAVREGSRKMTRFQELVDEAEGRQLPGWLSVDYDKMEGEVLQLPGREDIDVPVEEQLIVELYSR